MNVTSTDRIEKRVLLKASRSKVWKAIADPKGFSQWFGVDLAGSLFEPGAHLRGRLRHPGMEHLEIEMTIEEVQPERVFSWRWHPDALEAGVDYSAEPTTLVVFELEEADGGTLVTVVETGFDQVPAARRGEAYRGNDEGWGHQMQALERYVDGEA